MNNIDCSDIKNHFNDYSPSIALSQISKHVIYSFTYNILIGFFLKGGNSMKVQYLLLYPFSKLTEEPLLLKCKCKSF